MNQKAEGQTQKNKNNFLPAPAALVILLNIYKTKEIRTSVTVTQVATHLHLILTEACSSLDGGELKQRERDVSDDNKNLLALLERSSAVKAKKSIPHYLAVKTIRDTHPVP